MKNGTQIYMELKRSEGQVVVLGVNNMMRQIPAVRFVDPFKYAQPCWRAS